MNYDKALSEMLNVDGALAAAVVDFAAPDAPQPAKREATSTTPVRTFQVFFIMRSSPSFTRLHTKGFFLFFD